MKPSVYDHPDERALLATILAHPEADLPRLVYADWLDDNAVDRGCGECEGTGETNVGRGRVRKCPLCASGIARDGRRERGEFIRLQCEIAAGGCEVCGGSANPRCPACERLRAREAELWPLVCDGVRASLGDSAPPGVWVGTPGERRIPSVGADHSFVVRRGFVSEVRAPLAWLIGGACSTCDGLGRHRTRNPDTGWIGQRDCEMCGCTGRTPANLSELVAKWPITKVGVTDRRPTTYSYRGDVQLRWERAEMAAMDTEYQLPPEVFDCLKGGHLTEYIGDSGRYSCLYPGDGGAADTAACEAVLAWAKFQPLMAACRS